MQNQTSTTEEVGNATSLHNVALWHQMEAYQNEGVCQRFAEEQNVSIEESRSIFLEMKRFLYVAIICQQPCSPSKIIDAMWHTFIIYTAHYAAFCKKFNGGFIDHTPSEKPEIEGYARTREFATAIFGKLNENLWPDPSSKLAGVCMTAAGCTCSNTGCSCNCSNNLGVDAGLATHADALC